MGRRERLQGSPGGPPTGTASPELASGLSDTGAVCASIQAPPRPVALCAVHPLALGLPATRPEPRHEIRWSWLTPSRRKGSWPCMAKPLSVSQANHQDTRSSAWSITNTWFSLNNWSCWLRSIILGMRNSRSSFFLLFFHLCPKSTQPDFCDIHKIDRCVLCLVCFQPNLILVSDVSNDSVLTLVYPC